MEKGNFTNLIIDTYDYFNYSKSPNKNQMALWYEDVRFIPDVAMGFIFKSLKKLEQLPRNFPKTFIALWYDYRKMNPDKTVTDYEYCDDCYGHGVHMLKMPDNMYYPPKMITYVVRCSRCDNWKSKLGSLAETGGNIGVEGRPFGVWINPVPRFTKQEIIDRGWEYLPLSNPKAKRALGELPKVEFEDIPKAPRKYGGDYPQGFND